jgi:hypothetical protein
MGQVTNLPQIQDLRDQFFQAHGVQWNNDPLGRYIPFLEIKLAAALEWINNLEKQGKPETAMKSNNVNIDPENTLIDLDGTNV